MSGDFLQDWLTLWMAATVGLGPFMSFYGASRSICGQKEGDIPGGCLLIAGLLLLASVPLGYWFFQTFAVVWRP